MKINVYKTDKVTSHSHNLFELLDAALPQLAEGSIVAVAAKVVSLCEGRVTPLEGVRKDDLVAQEAQWYLPREGQYNVCFTITNNILIPSSGIDESNSNDHYILWPEDPQASANAIREHLAQKHGIQRAGVIITDSTTRPLQWGTTGIAIAYSGFAPLKDYIGTKDLFGREMVFQKSSTLNGLAAAAVVMMGEGDEQTPLAVLEDLPFVDFQERNPTEQEIAGLQIKREDDLYWPILKHAPWLKGYGGHQSEKQ